MVALPQTYNTADLPDTGGSLPLIPNGQYPAVIVASELKATKNNDGHYLALTVVITHGQYQGTEFIERLNIINKNIKAVEIAYKTLARISEAVGMQQTPSDSVQLHNKPFFIDVATEAGEAYKDNSGVERMGKDKSYIKKYLPVPNAVKSGVSSPFSANTANPEMATPTANNPFAPF